MPDSQIQEAVELLRSRLKTVMARENLFYEKELARYIGIPRSTLQEYLRAGRIPTPETLATIRKKVPEITDDDAEIISKAYSRVTSQSRSSGRQSRSGKKTRKSQPVKPSENNVHQSVLSSSSNEKDAELGRRVREMVNANPLGLVDLLSRLGNRYDVGDMPNVLTKDNFETLDVSRWTDLDKHQFLGYLNLLLEETRACMMLLAQFTPESLRDGLLERVGRNADLLWRTFKIASNVTPIEYVQDIDLAHKCQKMS